MNPDLMKRALAGSLGEEVQSDAVLHSMQGLLAQSHSGFIPGFQLGATGIYPSYSVEYPEDQEPNPRTIDHFSMRGFECRPAWDKLVCTVIPAAVRQGSVVVVPTNQGLSIIQKPIVPLYKSGGVIALRSSVRWSQAGPDDPIVPQLRDCALVSYPLAETPPYARLYIKVYGDSDRQQLRDLPTNMVGDRMLAWYGADGVLFGGVGEGEVTNVSNPFSSGFGKYEDVWYPNFLTIYV